MSTKENQFGGRRQFGWTFASAVALLLALGPGWPVASAAPASAEYIVTFRELPPYRSEYAGEPVVGTNEGLRFLLVHAADASAFRDRAARDANVLRLERDDEIYHTLLIPSDSLYATYQYNLKTGTTNMEHAWDRTLGASSVKVCVVDTGQYRDHLDFRGTTWGEWKDFVRGKMIAYDDNGHGTHVTGIVGAVIDNGRGIAGVAQVTVVGAKVLNKMGSGTTSAVANGITWCADRGAHVINLSLGGGYSPTIENAVNYAHGKGALVVAAAGNSGPCSNCVTYPAALPNAFAVACSDALDAQCTFSSQGPEVDITAPGLKIASTYPAGIYPCARKDTNCYVSLSGTSMSTPHVSALAALVKSAFPDATNEEIRGRIVATAADLGAPGPDEKSGAGLIQGDAVY